MTASGDPSGTGGVPTDPGGAPADTGGAPASTGAGTGGSPAGTGGSPPDPGAPVRGPALFARIGEAKLRAVLVDFYDRVFADVMIGFMFAGKDRAHLVEREYELTAKLLGAPGVTYRGMPMRTAHARHTIFGGQFERRLQILKETLADHDVDPAVRQVWIEHTLALRPQITHDRGSECETPPPKLVIAQAVPDPAAPIKLGRRQR